MHVHVIADAATSVLAIVALAGGWAYGWSMKFAQCWSGRTTRRIPASPIFTSGA
jgi:hypothetical protein